MNKSYEIALLYSAIWLDVAENWSVSCLVCLLLILSVCLLKNREEIDESEIIIPT